MNDPFFVILAPDWTPSSAGIRVMHQLCHELNGVGQHAYLWPVTRNPDLETPLITRDRIQRLSESGYRMVAVYPEGIHGNPLGSDVVVRWLLNKPNHGFFGPNDLFFSWQTDYFDQKVPRLWLPFVDENVFYVNGSADRYGACFYANKYVHWGGEIKPEHKRMINLGEVIRGDHKELAKILRRSEYVVCYEGTALSSEAMFCGCPTVWVISDYMKHPPGTLASEPSGCTIYETQRSIDNAKLTIGYRMAEYQKLKRAVPEMIQGFIDMCYRRANQ